jgi:hypothetical protein
MMNLYAVLVEAPGVPNSVVGLVGNDIIQNVLTHHESHGESNQSSASSPGDEGSKVQAEMPRSVPAPIFGVTLPTTGDTPPSSSPVPEAATSQVTPGSEPAQIPPDPLFQSSSGSWISMDGQVTSSLFGRSSGQSEESILESGRQRQL